MDDTTILTPTDTSADCTRFEAHCGGYLERDLDAAEQAWMTAHEAACAECAALVRDLEAIVAKSQTLPGIAPSRDLWSGIEARLDTTVIPISAAAAQMVVSCSGVYGLSPTSPARWRARNWRRPTSPPMASSRYRSGKISGMPWPRQSPTVFP